MNGLLISASLIFASILSAWANDLRIYFGHIKRQTFTSIQFAAEKTPTYLVIDQTTNQFAFIRYRNRTHYEQQVAIDVRSTVPNTPALTKISRQFIYSSSSEAGVPVDIFRFRSTA